MAAKKQHSSLDELEAAEVEEAAADQESASAPTKPERIDNGVPIPPKPRYRVVHGSVFKGGGEWARTGEDVHLSDEDAASLLAHGVIEQVE
jgi:hypothetical protein